MFAPLDGRRRRARRGSTLVATGHSVSAAGQRLGRPGDPVARGRAAGRPDRCGPGGFDVVHVHEPFAPGLPYALLLARGLPPLVGTFHRSGGSRPLHAARARWPAAGPPRWPCAARCPRRPRPRPPAPWAGTYEVALQRHRGRPVRGVEPWPTDGPTVLFLGRHEERKGLARPARGVRRLAVDGGRSDGGPVRHPVLWVAGDGPATAALRRRHPELGDAAVARGGRRGGEGPPAGGRRRAGRPSLGGESFGLVLLEAMAARTVVVASDIDGYRDAAGGRAVLVPPGDAGALADGPAGGLDGACRPDGLPRHSAGPRAVARWPGWRQRAAQLVDGPRWPDGTRSSTGGGGRGPGRERPYTARTMTDSSRSTRTVRRQRRPVRRRRPGGQAAGQPVAGGRAVVGAAGRSRSRAGPARQPAAATGRGGGGSAQGRRRDRWPAAVAGPVGPAARGAGARRAAGQPRRGAGRTGPVGPAVVARAADRPAVAARGGPRSTGAGDAARRPRPRPTGAGPLLLCLVPGWWSAWWSASWSLAAGRPAGGRGRCWWW